jgi:hypothetical protein
MFLKGRCPSAGLSTSPMHGTLESLMTVQTLGPRGASQRISRVWRRLVCALAIVAGVVACGGGASRRPHRNASSGAHASRTMAVAAAVGRCPISRPSGGPPPRRALLNFHDPIAKATDPGWRGNGTLWTNISPPYFVTSPSGALTTKMGWFRAKAGRVAITGRLLNGRRAPFVADVGTPAEYGPTGFTLAAMSFGVPGCWVLHATLARRVLKVVLRVAAPT